MRIGLHTGPVFEDYDAIIGRNNYFGSHVSRAARIEPVRRRAAVSSANSLLRRWPSPRS